MPSTDASGDWTRPDALATIRLTVEDLRRRGIRHIHLATLSQASASAAAVLEVVGDDIRTVMLLFGMDSSLERLPGPTLVLHARNDQRFSHPYIVEHAERLSSANADVTRVAVDGDHFALVKRRSAVAAIRSFLAPHVAR